MSYVAASKRENPKTAAAKRWAPWLCAYTGARVGKIVQLRKQNVRRRDDGVWTINITPEAGKVKDKEAREVVLHAHLVELGFGGFVHGSKAGYLFLNAAHEDDNRGVWRAVKNRLVDFAREVVTDKRVAPNHGWRHCLNEDFGDDPLKLWVVRCHFKRRVHQHAAFALRGARRTLDDIIDEAADCLTRSKISLESANGSPKLRSTQ